MINAVVDALRHTGIRHVEMPATPARIWGILRGEAQAPAAEQRN